MSNLIKYFIILSVVSFTVSFGCLQDTRVKRYYKIKNCRRSNIPAIGRISVKALKECASYAGEKNALAFNFSPPEATKNRRKKPTFNCQILGCPELNNFTALVNDTLFDYYSSYGNATVLDNATCIKSIGVFRIIHTKLNYSEAVENCQSLFSDLAHVLSETRTNSLAKLLSTLTDWYKAAYIGLDDRKIEGRYETPLGDPINCYKYRAWSPGQPRNVIKSDDCVILEDTRTWKIVNCRHQMPSLCELYPTPPDKYRNKYLDADCEDYDDSGERESCREYKRNKKKKRKNKNRCLD